MFREAQWTDYVNLFLKTQYFEVNTLNLAPNDEGMWFIDQANASCDPSSW